MADQTELRQVGRPSRRVDTLDKAVGATVYAGDFTMPGMLHAKVLRSVHPSAIIKSVDTAAASRLPGVACILTGKDLPGVVVSTDIPGQTGKERLAASDVPVLASDKVRMAGEPIALIAADTERIAQAASDLIEVEYEPLPGVFDPFDAMKPGAPIVHEPDNIVARWKIRKGDAKAAIEQADIVVENTFRMPFIDHAYIEPEAGVAWIDEQGVINIRVSTQVIEHFRAIADVVGVPHNKLRVQGAMVGGGFGGKEDITVEIFLALLAQRTGRPVRLAYTREESLLAHCKRHPFTITHRTGVTRDGRITGAEIELVSDSGSYPHLSPYVLLYATVTSTGPYRIDNVSIEGMTVATNNPYTSAFRGFGGSQACVAYEQQMDEIAKTLGMDPMELRRVNYLRTGDTTATGQPVESAAWIEDAASRAIDALGERTPDRGPVKIGRGLASYMQSYGRITWLHDTARAWVGMEVDGSVVVRASTPEIGAGQMSVLGLVAAEVLGVPLEAVTVHAMDSALTPLAGTSTATRQTYMSGNAVLKAAGVVRDTLLSRASEHLGESADSLALGDSFAYVEDRPDIRIAVPELAAMCAADGLPLSELAQFNAPFSGPIDSETGQGRVFPDLTFGAQAVEVAVDTETGEVTVLKSAACHDVGRAINPTAVEGQIQGGSAQGIGYALMEEVIVENGVIQTPTLSEYLIPTSLDFPPTQAIILESGTGLGPFGAKGIGEPAITPAAPAAANAVANAINARVPSLPLTPEKVLAAIDGARVVGGGRGG